jgi:hypothetical protein
VSAVRQQCTCKVTIIDTSDRWLKHRANTPKSSVGNEKCTFPGDLRQIVQQTVVVSGARWQCFTYTTTTKHEVCTAIHFPLTGLFIHLALPEAQTMVKHLSLQHKKRRHTAMRQARFEPAIPVCKLIRMLLRQCSHQRWHPLCNIKRNAKMLQSKHTNQFCLEWFLPRFWPRLNILRSGTILDIYSSIFKRGRWAARVRK